MAVLWADSFDQYAGSHIKLLDNWYSKDPDTIDWFWNLSTVRARTGTYSLSSGNRSSNAIARRAVTKSVTTVGLGFAFYLNAIPTRDKEFALCSFEDANLADNIGIVVGSDGALSVVRGHTHSDSDSNGTFLTKTAAGIVKARTWQHIETKCTFDSSAGSVEVRIDGVTVINISGINTVASVFEKAAPSGESGSLPECSYITLAFGPNGFTSNNGFDAPDFEYGYVDDVVVWDTSGSVNNDFIGDVKVEILRPTADTAQADWTALSGNAFENINDAPGDDVETSYIYAGTPGSPSEITSEFDIENLNSTSGEVVAVTCVSKNRKDTDDVSDIQNGIVSGGVEARGSTSEVNGIYHFKEDAFQVDPNTGVAFTPTNVNNLKIQLNRVT